MYVRVGCSGTQELLLFVLDLVDVAMSDRRGGRV